MEETLVECMEMVMSAGDVVADSADDLHLDDDQMADVLPSDSVCRVCGDSATGMYFGALVCVPCKVLSASRFLCRLSFVIK